MAALTLNTDAIVLLRRPSTADAFQMLTVFSPTHGVLVVLQRISNKAKSGAKGGSGKSGAGGVEGCMLDIFSEVALVLESSNQGRTWFVKEARLIQAGTGIGRNYEALVAASEFGALIVRNEIASDAWARIYALVRQVIAALSSEQRPDVAYFKAVYCFARDEGYPMRQEWATSLRQPEQALLADLLGKPLAEQSASKEDVAHLRERLEAYLRGHTELLLG